MKPIPIFRGECKGGKLSVHNAQLFSEYLRGLEGEVDVIVRKYSDRRSLKANRYYRGVVLEVFAKHCGYEVRELHTVLKKRFSIESTAKLNTAEFAEYVEQVIQLAAEMGCVVPPPEAIEVI